LNGKGERHGIKKLTIKVGKIKQSTNCLGQIIRSKHVLTFCFQGSKKNAIIRCLAYITIYMLF